MKNKLLIMTAIVLFASSLVGAFGVSSPYWETKPMNGYPGMDKEVLLNLQNKAGATEDVFATIEVIEGSEIASLSKEEYLVEEGSSIDVPLRIRIPSNAEIGKEYSVRVNTVVLADSESGGVGLSTGSITAFNVIVGEVPEREGFGTELYVALIVVLLILAIFFIANNCKTKKTKKKRKQ